MKLYVEINNEKHYIEKDIVEKYGLKEGQTTPSLGLEIKKKMIRRLKRKKSMKRKLIKIQERVNKV